MTHSSTDDLFSRKVTATLADLVSINSINPTLSPDGAGEAEVAAYIERFFSGTATEITRQPVFEGRDNIICRFTGQDPSRTLIFEAHMDTVSWDLSRPDALLPVVRGGSLYGRGACDTKGSMAAMLWAIRTLVEEDALPVNVVFIGAVDEEYRARGIYDLVKTGIRADGAVVGEPTGLRIVVAHKGCYRFSVVTHGKAVQSSRPEKGVNAIYKMVDVVNAFRARLEPEHRKSTHELVGGPTMNIGIIAGGKEVNTVPDRCSIAVDRRVIPGEGRDEVEREFDGILEELRAADPLMRVEVENRFFDPPLSTPKTAGIVSAARAACDTILGSSTVEGVTYGSDASKLSSAGIPSIVLGPGDIVNAHSPSEFVSLDEVVSAARIYREIIRNFRSEKTV